MYYYIFEQPSGTGQKRFQTKIKDLTGDTGIAGETVSPSPARNIDELAQIGSSKGYSTVVAVGSDLFLNRVASALLNQVQPQPQRKIVLGVIPWNIEKSYFRTLVGLKNLAHAVETLKFRKLGSIKVGLVEPNKYFISPIEIRIPKKALVKITTKDFQTQIQATNVRVTMDLTLECYDAAFGGSPLVGFWRWLVGQPLKNLSQTVFRHEKFNIDTPNPLPVSLETETIAKTPIAITRASKTLYLIVSRDRLEK